MNYFRTFDVSQTKYFAIRHDRPWSRGQGDGLLSYVKANIPFFKIPAYREEEVVGGLKFQPRGD
jgi:hypothetical protein